MISAIAPSRLRYPKIRQIEALTLRFRTHIYSLIDSSHWCEISDFSHIGNANFQACENKIKIFSNFIKSNVFELSPQVAEMVPIWQDMATTLTDVTYQI